jgi:hypothetical protein
MKKCSVPNCIDKHRAKGFCNIHYNRFLKYGDPLGGKFYLTVPRKRQPRGECTYGTCQRPHYARGWCTVHYHRWLMHGNPSIVLADMHGMSKRGGFFGKEYVVWIGMKQRCLNPSAKTWVLGRAPNIPLTALITMVTMSLPTVGGLPIKNRT